MTTDDIFEDLGEIVAIGIIVLIFFFIMTVIYWIAHTMFVCASNLTFRTDFAYPDWEDAEEGTAYCSFVAIFVGIIYFAVFA